LGLSIAMKIDSGAPATAMSEHRRESEQSWGRGKTRLGSGEPTAFALHSTRETRWLPKPMINAEWTGEKRSVQRISSRMRARKTRYSGVELLAVQ